MHQVMIVTSRVLCLRPGLTQVLVFLFRPRENLAGGCDVAVRAEDQRRLSHR